MELFNAIMLTLIKMGIITCFAGMGIFIGKKLRDVKDAKIAKRISAQGGNKIEQLWRK